MFFAQPVPWVKASQPQHTPAGVLLGKMYYGQFLQTVLKRDEYSGYPHNGGEHTLVLHLSQTDLQSFMDLVVEYFGDNEATQIFNYTIKRNAAVGRYH